MIVREDILGTLLSTPEGVSALIAEYKPFVYAACKEIFRCYEDLVDNDHYYFVRARDSKKMLDALINEGFSREEAMNIILANKIGMQSTMNKISGSSLKKK